MDLQQKRRGIKVRNINGPITEKDPPKISPLKLKGTEKQALSLINGIGDYPTPYPEKGPTAKG